MKFHVAWSSVINQNITLRAAVLGLSACCLCLTIAAVRLAVRQPLLIERECLSRVVTPVNTQVTPQEIDNFVHFVIPKRFDSDAVDSAVVLSSDEESFRNREQEELSKKSMSQRVVVVSVKEEGTNVTVDTDRILTIGKLRTALAFPLQISLSTTDRTSANPYGLVLKRVSQLKEEELKK